MEVYYYLATEKLVDFFDGSEIIKLTEITYDAIADKFEPLLSQENSSAEEVEAVDFFIKKLSSGSIIADLGCGVGKHGRYFAQKGFTVYGFDISSNMIKLAEQYNNRKEFAEMKVLQIAEISSFECDQKFDAVISAYAIIHLTYEQAERTLRNLHRHLNDQALIFITVYKGGRNNIYKETLAPEYKLYFRDYEKEEFKELITKCGYRIVDYKEWSDLDPITASNFDYDEKVLCVIAEYRKDLEKT